MIITSITTIIYCLSICCTCSLTCLYGGENQGPGTYTPGSSALTVGRDTTITSASSESIRARRAEAEVPDQACQGQGELGREGAEGDHGGG